MVVIYLSLNGDMKKKWGIGWVLSCSGCVLDNDGYNVVVPFSGDLTVKRESTCDRRCQGTSGSRT